MANFFLIDHSLKKSGGHHADYVNCVARAAVEMGFSTTIGTHARLGRCESIEPLGKIRRVFSQTTYQKDSYLAGLRHLTRAKTNFLMNDSNRPWLSRVIHRIRKKNHYNRRDKFIRNFAKDCARFFRDTIFNDGDHAFFTTVSELELLGLAAFLSNYPQTIQIHWHLQFHYNLFEGRTPEYGEQQEVASAIQSCFDAAIVRVPYHAIHFYTTSETLADQYNRLEVGNFDVLPYPVSPAFETFSPAPHAQPADIPDARRPLRLTCPGAIRREKGHLDYLQPLVDKIWNSHISTGNIKFAVQRSVKSKLELRQPESAKLEAASVEYLAHPLTDRDYVDFIKSTDCGLLYYDSRVYFSRRAGVLGELLSCGKPAIVSSGSWLSEQLQGAIFRHARNIASSQTVVRELRINDLRCDCDNVPLPGGIASFDQSKHPFKMKFDCLPGETGMVLSFNWHWPDEPGVFARIDVSQTTASGSLASSASQVIGQDREQGDSTAFFRFSPDAREISITLRNAFHDSIASVNQVDIITVNTKSVPPIGAVGIVAADLDDLPNCIDELVNHYPHYQKTAAEFASNWSKRHQPKRTVAHLISTEELSQRVA